MRDNSYNDFIGKWANFVRDKKMFGWKVRQRKEDRINTAFFCRDIWHNLFRL